MTANRHWLPAELHAAATLPPAAAARATGRTVRAVKAARVRYRLARRRPRWKRRRAVEWWRAGWGLDRIVKRLAWTRGHTRDVLRRAGFAVPPGKPNRRRAYDAVCRRFGAATLASVRWGAARRDVLLSGWPAGATPGDVAALEALAGGELASPHLAAAVGIAYPATGRNQLSRRMRRCLDNGWATRELRKVGRGGLTWVYAAAVRRRGDDA